MQNIISTENCHGEPVLSFASAIGEIVEREQTIERNLQQNRFQRFLAGMGDGAFIAGLESKKLQHVNASLCRTLDYSEEELLSASITNLCPTNVVSKILREVWVDQDSLCSVRRNCLVLRKDGGALVADISATRGFYNCRPCLIVVLRDVAEGSRTDDILRRELRVLRSLLQSYEHKRRQIGQQSSRRCHRYQAFASLGRAG